MVGSGVSNVRITNAEIGPCGQDGDVLAVGVDVRPGAANITIDRNVIHDVSTGVYVAGAQHPVVIDRNTIYNVRGPMPRGQAVQFNNVRGGSGSSKVTCNVSDRMAATTAVRYEDHLSFFQSHAASSSVIEIAYNRLRGGSSGTGSGIMLGDYGGSGQWAHHNVLVLTTNVGIGIAGGNNNVVEHNRAYNKGTSASSMTSGSFYLAQMSSEATCTHNTVRHNRETSRGWLWGGTGGVSTGYFIPTSGSSACTHSTVTDNLAQDDTLTAAIFDEPIRECGE